MNICVIGTGYVGLVTGVVFADLGNDVVCVDKLEEKVRRLQAGEMPIYEPGLEELVVRNVEEGRLSFTTELDTAVRRSDIVFICVGTPPGADGSTDMSQVEGAARGIAAAMDRYKVVVNKSTVPVGTGEFVREVIETNRRRNVDFDVVSNPEFLREGSAIRDALNPDRIVIGAPNQVVAMKVLELYAPLERPMIITDVASAEMIKYASNAFLAMKISFANAIANICDQVGADVVQVMKGVGSDARIGSAFLNAGLGYGGSCFPKD
ncbi:MAG: UDP-glucose dehydrogenase family protein, partial [Armatimonadota bacterium]